MIKIAISEAAFAAIAQTPLRGSVYAEPETNERGERTVWLNWVVADRLGKPCEGRARASAMSSCDWRSRDHEHGQGVGRGAGQRAQLSGPDVLCGHVCRKIDAVLAGRTRP